MPLATKLVLFCLFIEAGAEDATRAHAHKGIFRRLSPGSPQSAGLRMTAAARKRLLESTQPESSVMALPESPTSPKGTMRCSSIQLVHAPVSAIWETLIDLPRYPKFVGGISAVEPYSTRKTLTGGQLFCAHYTLCVGPLYKVKYFVEHRHEPLQKSMVWQLDYSRSSDVYDSVGYWHVEPVDEKRCIVYYTQDSLLPSWIPLPLKKSFTNAAMRACTGKLEPACPNPNPNPNPTPTLTLTLTLTPPCGPAQASWSPRALTPTLTLTQPQP